MLAPDRLHASRAALVTGVDRVGGDRRRPGGFRGDAGAVSRTDGKTLPTLRSRGSAAIHQAASRSSSVIPTVIGLNTKTTIHGVDASRRKCQRPTHARAPSFVVLTEASRYSFTKRLNLVIALPSSSRQLLPTPFCDT